MTNPYIVIGAGIVGATIARELVYRGIDTSVLDKEREAGMHSSGRNSGVIHSGINHKPESIKGKYCLRGNKLLREYCTNKGVPMQQCGTLVVARNDLEDERLTRILNMGEKLGVPDLMRLEGDGIQYKEPACTRCARNALYSPTGAIVDSKALLASVIGDAKDAGARFNFGEKVKKVLEDRIITDKGELQYDYLINCAGLEADRIAHMRGIREDLFIVPFRGSYWRIDQLALNTMVYCPPDPNFPFLGVHLTPTTNGLSLAGPNASLALGRESYKGEFNVRDIYDMLRQRGFWRMLARKEFLHQARDNLRTALSKSAFLKEINGLTSKPIKEGDIKPSRAGIRAQLVDSSGKLVDDLVVEHKERETHILNAVSPGMTCCLAFAEEMVKKICRER